MVKKSIIIESMFLYDYNHPELGVTVGGTQRYTLDLGKLFYQKGYEVTYLTKSSKNFETDYEDWAKIVAMDSSYGTKGNLSFSKKVFNYCNKNSPSIVCYSDLEIGWPYCYPNSFAIQHGIAWDTPYEKGKIVKEWLRKKALFQFKKVICVDTNFINWCREKYKTYFNQRDMLHYIPNYADLSLIDDSYKLHKQDVEKIIFFPRRFVPHRGADLFMQAIKQLNEKEYKIKALIAIQNFRNDDFKKQFPMYHDLNVEIVNPAHNDIYKYYKEAFITVIPTVWSEGTSLSAIESICAGTPVIVSDVGGLGNIVIPGFNGYICSPNVHDIAKSIENLLNNNELRNKMALNCLQLRESFGKDRWEKQIVDYLGLF